MSVLDLGSINMLLKNPLNVNVYFYHHKSPAEFMSIVAVTTIF